MAVIKHQKEGGRGIGSFLHLNPSVASQDAVGGEGRAGLAAAGQKNFSMHTSPFTTFSFERNRRPRLPS